MLDTPPTWAVLTGCETARVTEGNASAGIGLGQVLVVAGTTAVVAATARISSRDALRFAHRFYEALGTGQGFEEAYASAREPNSSYVLLVRTL